MCNRNCPIYCIKYFDRIKTERIKQKTMIFSIWWSVAMFLCSFYWLLMYSFVLSCMQCSFTSSNFFVISENALNIAFVEPETVTIRSGHDPSDILIFAPD